MFNYKKYHFVGIGGIGVSAIARMLFSEGGKVTGSDQSKSEITDDLEKMGIKIIIGHKKENIESDAEAIIYTIAVKEDNPEIVEAKKRGLPIFTYPQILGELSKIKKTIAVSGTHGKTTTTAMIGHILNKAGLDPMVIVGSKILGEESNFHAGKGEYLVVEACEYRRSFLNLSPTILVITNIDADHLDYYKDLEDIKIAFKELADKVPKSGQIITDTDYRKIDLDKINFLGEHNVLNAKAAVCAAMAAAVAEKDAVEYLKDFKGTWRRLEFKGEKNGDIFYDDYAHHPTEIKASLLALKQKHPNRKLVCIFEPHQQSRTKIFFDDFVKSLSLADGVFVAPIYAAREISDDSVSNKTLAGAINGFARAVQSIEELTTHLKDDSLKPKCIVFMGAGDIYKWTKKFI